MKERFAFALMGVACTVASAQSSTTLFGIVDVAVQHIRNGDQSINGLGSNGLATSRLGVRGYEDLGDGFKAGFWLEAGFSPDTGSQSDANRFWNRRSTVSLIDPRWGEIRLGRDKTPTYLAWGDFDPYNTNGVGSADKFLNKLGATIDTLTRADNLAAYNTPQLGGFWGTIAVAAGEGGSGKKYVGGSIGYARESYRLTASAAQTTVGADRNGNDKYDFYLLGGAYKFSFAEFLGSWTEMKFGGVKLNVMNIGALIPVGQRGTVRVGYARADSKGRTAAGIDTSSDDAHQVAVGYIYELSKRTALYGTAARVTNNGRAAYIVASSPAAQTGRDSTGYELGLRHSF
jgi:predicted porin